MITNASEFSAGKLPCNKPWPKKTIKPLSPTRPVTSKTPKNPSYSTPATPRPWPVKSWSRPAASNSTVFKKLRGVNSKRPKAYLSRPVATHPTGGLPASVHSGSGTVLEMSSGFLGQKTGDAKNKWLQGVTKPSRLGLESEPLVTQPSLTTTWWLFFQLSHQVSVQPTKQTQNQPIPRSITQSKLYSKTPIAKEEASNIQHILTFNPEGSSSHIHLFSDTNLFAYVTYLFDSYSIHLGLVSFLPKPSFVSASAGGFSRSPRSAPVHWSSGAVDESAPRRFGGSPPSRGDGSSKKEGNFLCSKMLFCFCDTFLVLLYVFVVCCCSLWSLVHACAATGLQEQLLKLRDWPQVKLITLPKPQRSPPQLLHKKTTTNKLHQQPPTTNDHNDPLTWPGGSPRGPGCRSCRTWESERSASAVGFWFEEFWWPKETTKTKQRHTTYWKILRNSLTHLP